MKSDTETSNNKNYWLGLGAVTAAIGASACCVIPLLFLSLGLSGAWMSTFTIMEPARPFFIMLTIVFMGLGYRKLYATPSVCEAGESCTTANIQRRQRMLFWIGSFFILILLAFPWFAPFIMA
jgi:mercuric ion transport protein